MPKILLKAKPSKLLAGLQKLEEFCEDVMNTAKWFAVRKPSTGKTIAKSDCGAEILLRYNNVLVYSPDSSFLYMEKDLGSRSLLRRLKIFFNMFLHPLLHDIGIAKAMQRTY